MKTVYNKSATNKLLIDISFAIIAFLLYSMIPIIIEIGKSNLFLCSMIALIVSFIFIFICYSFIRHLDQDFRVKNTTLSKALLVIILTLISSFILQSIVGKLRTMVLSDHTDTSNQQAIAGLLEANSLLVYSLVSIVIIAPVFEELIFRRVLIGNTLAPKANLIFRIVLSILLFTFLHTYSEISNGLVPFIFSCLSYLIISCSFTFIYVVTGRMTYSVLAHCINNLIAVSLLLAQLN